MSKKETRTDYPSNPKDDPYPHNPDPNTVPPKKDTKNE